MKDNISTVPYPAEAAVIHVGLQEGYNGKFYESPEIIGFLKNWQQTQFENRGIRLFPAVSTYEIVNFKNTETHLQVRILNLPGNRENFSFIETVRDLAVQLMANFNQNRILLELPQENVLLERTARWEF